MPEATQGAKYSLGELKLPRAAWVSLGPNPFFLMKIGRWMGFDTDTRDKHCVYWPERRMVTVEWSVKFNFDDEVVVEVLPLEGSIREASVFQKHLLATPKSIIRLKLMPLPTYLMSRLLRAEGNVSREKPNISEH